MQGSSLFDQFEQRRQTPSDIADHLFELYTWARGWKFPKVLELGTRSGNSTCAFLAAMEINRKGMVWSVDRDEPQVPSNWLGCKWWQFLQADDMSMEAQAFAPPELDVLFIDTDHEYEHTLAELRIYGPRVTRGGVILMHDTEYGPGAARGVDPHESAVGKALDQYCAETGYEWENRAGCFGLGVLRVR